MAAARSHGLESEITPDHILIGYRPRVQALAARLRDLVRETVPDAVERAYPVWRGIGYRHPESGYFCGIFPQEDCVRLVFEYGALLADPDDLLKGNGKQTRYVQIRRQKDIRVHSFKRLTRSAVEFRRS